MINITQLLDKCLSENRRKRHEQRLQCVVLAMIPHIGKTVLFKDELVTLSWEHVSSHLNSPGLYTQLVSVFEKLSTRPILTAEKLVIFKFPDAQTANAFFDFTYAVLPIRKAEYPKINNAEFILTDEQHYCYQFYAMQCSGKLTPEMLGDQYFLKTLRADTLDYSYAFILGIMPGSAQTKRQNLRYMNRGNYTIDAKGRPKPRINKEPMYTPDQKKGFSQIQSCTFIDNKLLSPAFGFTKERNRKLYGLMTHWHDALINRMLVNDGGTVGHVFDVQNITLNNYKSFSQESSNKKRWYSTDELGEFKTRNIKERPDNLNTNECLVRLRFNIYRSIVSICSDTLESRLLAYDFATELLETYAEYAEKNGLGFNKNFRIPILFYIRKKLKNILGQSYDQDMTLGGVKHELKFYTKEMYEEDRKKAAEIYGDLEQRRGHYQACNYEFLLGLPTITPAILLEEESHGLPLICAMIRNGYVRMVGRLVRKSSDRKNLLNDVCQELLKRNCINRNDNLISQLILAEAFDIAEMLIGVTKSDKYSLSIGSTTLVSHLINYGNPRQLNFMGFDTILIRAAEHGAWVTIILCIKEYPEIDKGLLGKLLCYACQRSKYKEAELLLKMGAYISSEVWGLRAIQHAIEKKDWAMVGIFAQFPADSDDFAIYGFALLKALQYQQRGIAKLLLLAGAKPYWRRFIKDHEMESALYYAVEHGYDELLPDLIKHESGFGRSIATTRRWLAADLATVKKNEQAIELLSEFRMSDSLFMDDRQLVCRLVVEALAIGNREIAIYRLKKNLSSLKLESNDHNIIMQGFRIVKDHLVWSFSFLSKHYKKNALRNIVEILCEHKEELLLIELAKYFRTLREYSWFIDDIFFETILKKISAHNIDFIRGLIKVIAHTLQEMKSWQDVINRALYSSVDDAVEDAPYLLLELGAKPDSGSGFGGRTAVERVADKGDERLLKHLLETYSFNDTIKASILISAIKNDALKSLALEMIVKHKTRTHPKHIVTSILWSREQLLIPLLNAVDKHLYYDQSFQYAFFNAWVHGCKAKNKMVCAKLIALLGPVFIKHLTILYLVGLYKVSLSNWEFPRYLFPNLDKFLTSDYLTLFYRNSNKITLNPFHEKILQILNNYCSLSHSVPQADVITRTFENISSHLKKVVPKSSNSFFAGPVDNSLEGIMLRYLERVDVLIASFKPEAQSESRLEL